MNQIFHAMQITVFIIHKPLRQLLKPFPIYFLADSSKPNFPSKNIFKKENVVTFQTLLCQHFNLCGITGQNQSVMR